MKKSNQHNHPKKGDNITVAPIRRIEDIKSISKLLSDSPRNHLLFHPGNQQRTPSWRPAQTEGKSLTKPENRRHAKDNRIKDRKREYTCGQQGRSQIS